MNADVTLSELNLMNWTFLHHPFPTLNHAHLIPKQITYPYKSSGLQK